MPKERDHRRAIDCLRLDCKHLYLEIIFGILRSDDPVDRPPNAFHRWYDEFSI
ncbi:hypothetical protein [Microcoleus sp. N9_A1]|uniref:hypothetical protein n=1 Tax=Microcoleus sp. N9_A1 TaxID=3055380 RepID=UPI002FD4D498